MKIRPTLTILLGVLLLLNPFGLQAAVNVSTANTPTTVTNANFAYGIFRSNVSSTSVSPSQQGGSYGVTISSPAYNGAATVASGSAAAPYFELTIANTTGMAIDTITIAATMVQFKANTNGLTETLIASMTGLSPTTITATGSQNDATSGIGALTLKSSISGGFLTGSYNVTMSGFTLAAGESFTIRWTDKDNSGTDAMFGLANMSVTLGTSAPANNDTVIAANTTNVALGRVMQTAPNTPGNVTLNKTGGNSTTYSVVAEGDASVEASGSFAGGSQSEQITVGVDRSTTGVKNGAVTIDNQATTSNAAGQGSADPDKVIDVSATVVADRQINGTVDAGNVFVGATVTGTATLTTTGDHDHFTDVTVSGSAVTQGNISVAEGSTTTFNDASDTTTREITATFTQSTTGATDTIVDLVTSGEGLVGEQDKATVTVKANVFLHASLSANDTETLTNGSSAWVQNAFHDEGDDAQPGGQRAAAVVSSKATKGAGWSATAFTGGSENDNMVTEGVQMISTVSFDSTNKLNGTHVGSLVVAFADEAGIQGGGSLGTKTWQLSAVVSGNSAAAGVAQVASVLAGNSFAGLNTTGADFNADGVVTKIAIRAGIASADRDLSMTFSNINPGAKDGVANDISRISDIVSLEGTGSDVIVVEMSYMNVANESAAALGWLAGDEWVYATDGNSGAGSLAGAYTMSYDDFLAANGGVFNATTMLGAYGVDTSGNTAWAVINHNSDFAVNTNLATIPEPGTMVLAALGGLALCFRRRSRR